MTEKQESDWCWPEKGRNHQFLAEKVKKILSPYEVEKPPFCYPGTTLNKSLIGRVKTLIAKQINAIGTQKWRGYYH